MYPLDVIDRIKWFRNLPEARPGVPWDKEFEDRAYIRWACDELMQDLMARLDISAETTIDTFWFRMVQYCHYPRHFLTAVFLIASLAGCGALD